MAKGLKTYLEYSVKYDKNENPVVKFNGEPEVDEIQKECRLDQTTVKVLNDNWPNFRKFYVLKEETEASKPEEKQNKEEELTPIEPQTINLKVSKDINELTAALNDEEAYKMKVATMTKQELCNVLDSLKYDHSECKFQLTTKDTYGGLVKIALTK